MPFFRSRVVCTLAVFAGLQGCTMIPPLARPEPAVSGSFPGGENARPGQSAADVSWRGIFRENRLRKLIDYALVNNRDLRVAMLNADRTRAQYRIEAAGFQPTADAGATFLRQKSNEETTNQWRATVATVSYELDLFGRVRSQSRQALEQYFAAEEGRRAAQILLVSQVATEYFTQRQLDEQLILARQTLAAVEKTYNLNQITADAGATSELDLRTSEAQVHTARVNILTYDRLLLQSRNALVLLLGAPLPGGLPPAGAYSQSNPISEIPPGVPADLIQRRPDILQAEHNLAAANASIGAARAAFFPTIRLTGAGGGSSGELNDLFSSGTGFWSFSPQIDVPIFSGGRNQANLDVAKITTRVEIATYQKAIQTAFREVSDALGVRGSYRQEVSTLEALIKAQRQRYDLADERYRQGEDSYLNVLSAQRDLYSAQQRLIQTRLDLLTNDISLYKALGGGWK